MLNYRTAVVPKADAVRVVAPAHSVVFICVVWGTSIEDQCYRQSKQDLLLRATVALECQLSAAGTTVYKQDCEDRTRDERPRGNIGGGWGLGSNALHLHEACI